jgi:hypothetical protein
MRLLTLIVPSKSTTFYILFAIYNLHFSHFVLLFYPTFVEMFPYSHYVFCSWNVLFLCMAVPQSCLVTFAQEFYYPHFYLRTIQ